MSKEYGYLEKIEDVLWGNLVENHGPGHNSSQQQTKRRRDRGFDRSGQQPWREMTQRKMALSDASGKGRNFAAFKEEGENSLMSCRVGPSRASLRHRPVTPGEGRCRRHT